MSCCGRSQISGNKDLTEQMKICLHLANGSLYKMSVLATQGTRKSTYCDVALKAERVEFSMILGIGG